MIYLKFLIQLLLVLVFSASKAWAFQADLDYSFVSAEVPLEAKRDPLEVNGKIISFSLNDQVTKSYKLGVTLNYLELNLGPSDKVGGLGQTVITQEINLLEKNESGVQLALLANIIMPTHQLTANGMLAEKILDSSGGTGYAFEIGPKALIFHRGGSITTVQATTKWHQKDKVDYFVPPSRPPDAALVSQHNAFTAEESCKYNGCQVRVARQLGTTTTLNAAHLFPVSRELLLGGAYTYSWTGRGSYESDYLSEKQLAELRAKSDMEAQFLSAMMVYFARIEKQNFSIVGKSSFSVQSVNTPSIRIVSLGFGIPF